MSSADLGRLALLAPLAVLQVLILARARAAARHDPKAAFGRLGEAFAADLKRRAGRGEGPDWLRYRGEVERQFEGRDERLRMLAAAALAAGLASTLITLLAGIWWEAGRPDRALDAQSVLRSAGICLVGSLVGVAVNLVIVLGLLPAAERRFSAQADALFDFLAAVADQNPPVGALTGPLREELAAIRESLAGGLAQAFAGAVTGWPLVVERLGGQVEALGRLVAEQAVEVGKALEGLAASSAAVARSSAALEPSVRRLGDLGGLLVELPANLDEVLNRRREEWLADLRQQHEAAVKRVVELSEQAAEAASGRERQMLAAVRELQAAVADQHAAVGRIPGLLAAEVRGVARELGREFGSEARTTTLDLARSLAEEHERLWQRIEAHEREVRNNVGAVVAELFSAVKLRVDDGIATPLRLAAEGLQGVAATLPAAAARIEEAQRGWSSTQSEALSGWQQTGDGALSLAMRLSEVDGHLERGVRTLAGSADHLERIAGSQEGFERSLEHVLAAVVSRHLAETEPYRAELMRMVSDLQAAHGELDEVLRRQADLIRRCIEQVVGRRSVAALAAMP
jgi:hypothetical protein